MSSSSDIQSSASRKHPIMRLNAKKFPEVWTLWYAAKNGKNKRVEALIKNGVDVNAVDDIDGRSALHWAARNNHFEAAKMLINSGSSVNCKDKDGNTPLHLAAGWASSDVVCSLLGVDADVDIKNNAAMIAKDVAIKMQRDSIASVFERWTPVGRELPKPKGKLGIRSSEHTYEHHEISKTKLHLNSLDIKKMVEKGKTTSSKKSIATALVRLATSYREENNLQEACETRKIALKLAKKIYGAKSLPVIACLNGYGECLYANDRVKDAVPLFKSALNTFSRLTGDGYEAHDNAIVLHNYAICLLIQGKASEAEKPLKHAIRISTSNLGNIHQDVSKDKFLLAYSYKIQGKYSESLRVLRECLDMNETISGRRSKEVAYILDSLAEVAFLMANYDLAEGLFLRALKIRTLLYGHSSSSEMRLTQTNLACVLRNKDKALREKDKTKRAEAKVTLEVSKLIKGQSPSASASGPVTNNSP